MRYTVEKFCCDKEENQSARSPLRTTPATKLGLGRMNDLTRFFMDVWTWVNHLTTVTKDHKKIGSRND